MPKFLIFKKTQNFSFCFTLPIEAFDSHFVDMFILDNILLAHSHCFPITLILNL